MEYKVGDEILWRLRKDDFYGMLEHGKVLEIRDNVILIEQKNEDCMYHTGWYLKDEINIYEVLK